MLVSWAAIIYWKIYTGWTAGNLFEDRELEFIDFVYFYAAGLLAKNSPPFAANPYEPVTFTSWVNQALAPAHLSGSFAFQYPPYCLLFFRPLAELSLANAWLVWSTLGAVGIVAAVALVCAGTKLGIFGRIAFAVGALSSFPVWAALRIGQTSLFETAAIALAIYLLRQHPLPSGLATGFCMLKPQFAPPAIFAGITVGRKRYLTGVMISFGILLLTSLFTVSLTALQTFAGSVFKAEARSRMFTHLVPERMQNLRGTLVLLTGGDGPMVAAISYAAWLLVMVALAWLWLRLYGKLANRTDGPFELFSAVSILAVLLFSPHCYAYDDSLLAVACPLLWISTGRVSPGDTVTWRRRGMRMLIVCLPVLTWVHAFCVKNLQATGIQSLFLWGLVLLTLTAGELATWQRAVRE